MGNVLYRFNSICALALLHTFYILLFIFYYYHYYYYFTVILNCPLAALMHKFPLFAVLIKEFLILITTQTTLQRTEWNRRQ